MHWKNHKRTKAYTGFLRTQQPSPAKTSCSPAAKAEVPHGMAWVPLSPSSTPATPSIGCPWPETVLTKELVTALWLGVFQTYCSLGKPVFLEIEGGIVGLINEKIPACSAATREAVQGCLSTGHGHLEIRILTWLSAAWSPGFPRLL